MRYTCLIALAITMAMPTVSTPADEPTADQRLRPGGHPPRRSRKKTSHKCMPSVFAESGIARFRLVSGRLDVDPMRYRKGSQEHLNEDYTETITVSSSRGVPSVYYSYRDAYQRIQLVAQHGKSLRIESTLNATGEQAILEQVVHGDVTWSVKRNPAEPSELDLTLTGATLLHIIGLDESGFSIHLDALVTRMLRGRSLIELAHQTEAALQQNYASLSSVSTDQVNDLIDQLRSTKSLTRRSAAKQLARMGSSIVPHLNVALKRDDLDVEQRSRIERIVQRCPRVDEDTASSLAYLLATDRTHWQIMAKKMDQEQWIAANNHVQRCGLAALTR